MYRRLLRSIETYIDNEMFEERLLHLLVTVIEIEFEQRVLIVLRYKIFLFSRGTFLDL